MLANAAYCALAGRDREQLLGLSEGDVFGECEEIRVADAEAREAKRPMHVPQRFPAGEGRSIERLTVRIPLSDPAGEVTHIVCVVGDSGDVAAPAEQLDEEIARYERERARALRSVQDQLLRKERLMVLGQLAAGLAHQIRNPLSAITNAIALATKQIPGGSNAAEALSIANEEVWVANGIIADLLDYARIRPPSRRTVRLKDLVTGAVDEEPLPGTIEVRYLLEDSPVHVDGQQVQDALRNLVRNAREAMEDHGTLSFRSRVDGEWVELWVDDTGIGVRAEQRHLLFEPLITSKPLGIGLGLPTARALVMNQGGTLECVGVDEGVSDNDANGARFVMRLPMSEEAPLSA